MGWGKATGADPVGHCWAQSCQPDPPTRAPGRQRAGPLGWERRSDGRFASLAAPGAVSEPLLRSDPRATLLPAPEPHLRSDPVRPLRTPTPP
jgi:hypothetical protein